jgi:hypothetical protein
MTKDCIHYWILESAEQAVLAGRIGESFGVCKYCEKKKLFRNSVPRNNLNIRLGNG